MQLDPPWTDKLARLPETGMGYQRVHKAGRTVENALVYNASVLEIPDSVTPFSTQDIGEIELAAKRSR